METLGQEYGHLMFVQQRSAGRFLPLSRLRRAVLVGATVVCNYVSEVTLFFFAVDLMGDYRLFCCSLAYLMDLSLTCPLGRLTFTQQRILHREGWGGDYAQLFRPRRGQHGQGQQPRERVGGAFGGVGRRIEAVEVEDADADAAAASLSLAGEGPHHTVAWAAARVQGMYVRASVVPAVGCASTHVCMHACVDARH